MKKYQLLLDNASLKINSTNGVLPFWYKYYWIIYFNLLCYKLSPLIVITYLLLDKLKHKFTKLYTFLVNIRNTVGGNNVSKVYLQCNIFNSYVPT